MTRRLPPKGVVIYWDRHGRAWWAYRVDDRGHQVAKAVNAYTYEDCLAAIEATAKPRPTGPDTQPPPDRPFSS